MDFSEDQRIVLTLDAGGTQFVFGAIQGGKAVVEPLRLPSNGDLLDRCLETMVSGFRSIQEQIREAPWAISIAFPGPADYPAGIIGDLGNLPAFRGGIPLGPMLENRLGLPVCIHNDGDLFTYGEAISGFLPKTNRALEAASSRRRFRNLLGVTIGTGFGAGLVTGETLYLGDNGTGMEIWSMHREETFAEEGVSARALCRVYAQEAGIPLDDAPEPRIIAAILDGDLEGHRTAASRAFSALGEALGDSLANAMGLTDSLVVVGGGIALAHRHFLSTAVGTMNGHLRTLSGERVRRMDVTAYNLEDEEERCTFLSENPREVRVPGTDRRIPYLADKTVGVGVSVHGTSEAVAIGAYAMALETCR